MFCRKCGQSIEESSKFCPFCGAPTTPTSTESTQPTPPPQPAPPPQPSYGYVPAQSANNNANQFQQPTQAYSAANPAYDYASVQTPYGADTLAIKRSKKWPVIIPILMLLSAILTAVVGILQFDSIVHGHWTTILEVFGTLFLLIICMIVFFAKTKRIPLVSAVFHTLLFLIPIAIFVAALIEGASLSFDRYWTYYITIGAAFLMLLLYLIGAGFGQRNALIGILYLLFALALCVFRAYELPEFLDYFDRIPTETKITYLCSIFELAPACLGFTIALFSLPSRKAL